MYKLLKLSKIEDYRIYKDFKWQSDVNIFTDTNLIFGWNGSGKSTFADLLYQLSNNIPFNDMESFELLFQNELAQNIQVTRQLPQNEKYSIMVFDQNYIERNISKIDSIKHIFAIGEGQIDAAQKIKDDRKESENLKTKLQLAQREKEKFQKLFDQLIIKNASTLKNELNLGNSYNKNTFLQDYNNFTQPRLLDDSSYRIAKSTLFSSQLPQINHIPSLLIDSDLLSSIRNILNSRPIISAIESLRDNDDLASWVEEGLALHKKHKSSECFFCGNSLSVARLAALEAHFNKEYIDISDNIDQTIEQISNYRQQYSRLGEDLLSTDQIYPELIDKYQREKDNIIQNSQQCISILDNISNILKSKQKKIVSTEFIVDFDNISNLTLLTIDLSTSFNEVISTNNLLATKHQFIVNESMISLKSHWMARYHDEMHRSKNLLQDSEKIVQSAEKVLFDFTKALKELESTSSSAAIPAKLMNENIHKFLGRKDIEFIAQDTGYSLLRKGKLASNLSKGEKNAIALIYFFCSLLDINVNRAETIVVLDDPISSFDSNYYYHAISYIRCNLEGVGQSFILTHKFSFYKDLCKMCDHKTNHYVIERDFKGVRIVDENHFYNSYYDEYIYIFNRIINYVTTTPSDPDESLTMANLSRKLLESYLTFKIPIKLDNLEKIRKLTPDLNTSRRAIMRLVNTKSHLRIIREEDSGDELSIINEMPTIARELLQFIFETDQLHFVTLLENCEIKLENVLDSGTLDFSNPKPRIKYRIKLYDWPASAGYSFQIDDNTSYSDYSSEVKCDFAVKISGASMEPKIQDGDIAFVEICETLPHGSIGVFSLNGTILCKRLIEIDGKTVLKSDHTDKNLYPNIIIGSDDTLKVFGKVVSSTHMNP